MEPVYRMVRSRAHVKAQALGAQSFKAVYALAVPDAEPIRAAPRRRRLLWGGLAGVLVLAGVIALNRNAVLSGSYLKDFNQDGLLMIACIGDSNTFTNRAPKWCEKLNDLYAANGLQDPNDGKPDWTTQSTAFGGLGVVEFGLTSLNSAIYGDHLTARPDGVIMQFTTNDCGRYLSEVAHGAPLNHNPASIFAAYQQVYNAAEREKVFIIFGLAPHATPKFDWIDSETGYHYDDVVFNQCIDHLNELLKQNFPWYRIVDLGNLDIEDHFLDSVHMNDAGQDKRAIEAYNHTRIIAAN